MMEMSQDDDQRRTQSRERFQQFCFVWLIGVNHVQTMFEAFHLEEIKFQKRRILNGCDWFHRQQWKFS